MPQHEYDEERGGYFWLEQRQGEESRAVADFWTEYCSLRSTLGKHDVRLIPTDVETTHLHNIRAPLHAEEVKRSTPVVRQGPLLPMACGEGVVELIRYQRVQLGNVSLRIHCMRVFKDATRFEAKRVRTKLREL